MIHFDLENLQKELDNLEKKINDKDFWQDNNKATEILTKSKRLKNKKDKYESLIKRITDIEALNELLLTSYDEEMAKDVLKSTKQVERETERLEMETLLSGKYDKNNAILTMHPGAGGTESQDWVQMLYRMYCKWATSNNFSVKELDFLEGDEARYKKCYFFGFWRKCVWLFKRRNGST